MYYIMSDVFSEVSQQLYKTSTFTTIFFLNLQESPGNDESNIIILINGNPGSGKTVHDHIFSIFKIYYIFHYNECYFRIDQNATGKTFNNYLFNINI